MPSAKANSDKKSDNKQTVRQTDGSAKDYRKIENNGETEKGPVRQEENVKREKRGKRGGGAIETERETQENV